MQEEPVEIDLRLNHNIDTEGTKATQGMDAVSDASAKMQAETNKAMEAQKKVITSLSAELKALKTELAKPVSTNDATLIKEKEQLTQSVAALEKKLKDAEAAYASLAAKGKTTSTTTTTVGKSSVTAAKGVNQLGYSVQQVARELPSLAISPQMFFLAISNNLPILQDQLRKTRLENEALKKSNQTTVPVWKQVMKSIVSWQTLLVVGVTLLTVYGKEIVETIGNMLNFSDAAKLTRKEIKALTDTMGENMGTELGKMNQLFDKLKDAQKGTQDYYDAKRDIIKQYGSYLSGLDAEVVALNNVEAAHKAITAAIVEQAKEKALQNLYTEQFEAAGKVTTEELPKLRSQLVDRWGEGIGQHYYEQIQKELDSGQGLSYAMQRIVDDFARTETRIVPGTQGQSTYKVTVNEVQQAIDRMTTAQDNANQKIKEGRKLFSSLYDGASPKIKSLIQDQKDLIEQYKLMPEATEEQIVAKNKLIETAEKEIQRLQALGKTPTTSTSGSVDDDPDTAAETLRKTAIELQQDVDAATIAAMQDGARKKLAQVETEYKQRKTAIAEKLKEIEALEAVTGTTSTGNRALLNSALDAYTAQYEAEKKAIESASQAEIDAVFSDVNQRFTTDLQNQLNSIKAYYAQQIQTIRENATTEQQLRTATAELEKKQTQELAIANAEYQMERLKFDEEVALQRQEYANDELLWEADKQKELLKIQIEYAQKRMQALNAIVVSGGDAEEKIKALIELLKKLNVELDSTNGSKLTEITDAIGKSVSSLASALSDLPGALGEIGKALGGVSDNVDAILTGFSDTASTGDVISAGVQGLSNLVSMVGNQIAENKQMQEEWTEKISEAAHEAAMLRIELQAYQEANIFGIENPYSAAIAGAQQYATALGELIDSADALSAGYVQVGTTTKVSAANIATGLASGAAVGAAVGTVVPVVGNLVGAVVGGLVGGIVGLFSKKRYAVYESLADHYGEIYDEETFELNPEILADYEKLDDATKELVDNWEEIRDAALEAQEQMRDVFEDLAGDIGTNLSDALVDAFKNNALTSAMEDFEGSVTAMIENIIQQLVFAMYFQDMLDELQQGFEDSFATGGDQDIIDDIIKFTKEYAEAIPGYMEAMAAARDEMANQGFDIFQADERTASSSGIAQASQDTVDEMNGRITNIQQMIYDIRANGAGTLNVSNELLAHQQLIRSQIDVIAENSAHLTRLSKIESTLSDISLKGVKIKN